MHVPSSPPALAPQTRKRRIYKVDEVSHLSSDPPTFSSDPPDAAIDYDRNRKRIYKGSWWSHRSPAAHKIELERNFDSGVFMASDDSLPSSDAHIKFQGDRSMCHATTASCMRYSKCESPAQLIVKRALEHGEQIIDLSNLQLSSLSNDIPLALLSLVNPPRFQESLQSPDEQEYQSLVSTIQLFLANNALHHLPPTIWKLQDLTVLSLRNNRLTSIPGGISKLSSLQELNLSNNCLRWLPWELLKLLGPGKPLTRLHVRPNPLFTGIMPNTSVEKLELPTSIVGYRRKMEELSENTESVGDESTSSPSWWLFRLLRGILQIMESVDGTSLRQYGPACLWNNEGADFVHRCVAVAISDISYLSKDGSAQGPPQRHAPSALPDATIYVVGHDFPQKKSMRLGPGVQSLLELAMKQCAVSLEAEKRILAQMMDAEAPDGVLRAIDWTYEAITEGSRPCSTCSRQYIIPRTEWIEYWHCIPSNASTISPDEMFWPFLRRGCSWACVN